MAVGVVCALFALAGCSDAGYSSAVEDNFVDSCAKDKRVNRSFCECLYARVKKNVSYEDFKALDDAIGTEKKAPAKTRREFNAAARSCRSRL
jgi:hypothetical protein